MVNTSEISMILVYRTNRARPVPLFSTNPFYRADYIHPKYSAHTKNKGTQWRIYIIKFWTPPGPNSFNFVQFWKNLAQSYVRAP